MALKEEGAQLGPALLFFGCRNRRMVIIFAMHDSWLDSYSDNIAILFSMIWWCCLAGFHI